MICLPFRCIDTLEAADPRPALRLCEDNERVDRCRVLPFRGGSEDALARLSLSRGSPFNLIEHGWWLETERSKVS